MDDSRRAPGEGAGTGQSAVPGEVPVPGQSAAPGEGAGTGQVPVPGQSAVPEEGAGTGQVPARLLALIREAVAAHSPTYHEAPAVGMFERAAASLGLRVRRVPVEDARDNLVVEAGPQPPAVALVGHVDTIEGGGPAQAQTYMRDGILYGLGTADMKAACMAMLYAASEVAGEVEAGERDNPAAARDNPAAARDNPAAARDNPAAARDTPGAPGPGGFAIHLVVGEEEYGDGAAMAVQELSAPLVVVGEPTGMRVCLDHYNYYEAILHTTGSRVHAALPELGANAISAMLEWISAINTESGRTVPLITNLRCIEGGSEQFLVPERCEAYVDIHTPADISEKQVEQALDSAARTAHSASPECAFSHTREFYSAGFSQRPDDPRLAPVFRALAHIGREQAPAAFRSHSDAPRFFDHGIATVVCGPGNLAFAHTADEHIELSQIAEGVRFYTELLRIACGVR